MLNPILKRAARLLAAGTPELEPAELREFVAGFVDKRDLFLRGRQRCGSPLYVFDALTLLERVAAFRSAFSNSLPGIRIYYAMKSNNHPLVSKALVEDGLGLDVSSGLELTAALKTGCEDIVFSGPGKSDRELASAVAHADRITILLDSFSELERLDVAAGKSNAKVRAGVRIATGESGIWRKFGVPLAALSRFVDKAAECRHVHFCGLQFHVSWNRDPGPYVRFLRSLGRALSRLDTSKTALLDFIDIGGGFWPERGEWLQAAGTPEGRLAGVICPDTLDPLRHFKLPSAGIARFAREIAGAFKRHVFPFVDCRICVEPGRWLCNDAMHLLMTVADRKAHDLVITDAGMNAIGWERFETDYFPVINLSRPGMTERPCMIMGSLCTPHDVWGYAYHGEGIERGDVLLIPCQGAYTYSLRQNFIKPLPAAARIRNSKSGAEIEMVKDE